MSRYIDADELLMAFGEVRADYNCFNELERPRYEMWSNAIDFINTMARSNIDIVRCKECKHWKWIEWAKEYRCTLRNTAFNARADDFCSYGCRDSEKPNNSKERSSE